MGHEMAEHDESFIDRIMYMTDEELLAYLHSLPSVQKKAMEEAIFRAMSQRAVSEHIGNLNGGPSD
jgi:hypothetical protein